MLLLLFGDVTGQWFSKIIGATRQLPTVLHDLFILLPVSMKQLIIPPHFIRPFTEISDLIQLFKRDLQELNLHTSPQLMAQLVIRDVGEVWETSAGGESM